MQTPTIRRTLRSDALGKNIISYLLDSIGMYDYMSDDVVGNPGRLKVEAVKC